MHPCLSSLEAFAAAPVHEAAAAVFLFAFVDEEGPRRPEIGVAHVAELIGRHLGFEPPKKQAIDFVSSEPWATLHGVVDEAVICLELRLLAARRLRGPDFPHLVLVPLRRGTAAARAGTLAAALGGAPA